MPVDLARGGVESIVRADGERASRAALTAGGLPGMVLGTRREFVAMTEAALEELLVEIRACTHCAAQLPLGPRPVLRASSSARILIVGQAPGTKVHATGIPWNDPSGDRLRQWLDLDRDTFYDESRIAIVPMGLCYPGKGKSGDLPPRKECAQLWFDWLFALLPNIGLTVLCGQYAQRHHLGSRRRKTLTATVAAWRDFAPRYFALPHPSPRNQLWFKSHPWFARETVPALRRAVRRMLSGTPKRTATAGGRS